MAQLLEQMLHFSSPHFQLLHDCLEGIPRGDSPTTVDCSIAGKASV